MRAIYKILIFLSVSVIFSGCMISNLNPFSSRTFEVKEGYLSISKINENIILQLPMEEKVGSNKVKIVGVKVFSGSNKKSLYIEVEFIFTSFEIPEGLPAIARFNSSLAYYPKSKEFKFKDINFIGVKFLKEQLVEYITPQQMRFIPDSIKHKLKDIVLHKSKKQFTTIRRFEAKEGKIKVEFN